MHTHNTLGNECEFCVQVTTVFCMRIFANDSILILLNKRILFSDCAFLSYAFYAIIHSHHVHRWDDGKTIEQEQERKGSQQYCNR